MEDIDWQIFEFIVVIFLKQQKFDFLLKKAQVAQLVEQWTENPRVGGSNPPLGTTLFLVLRRFMVPLGIDSDRVSLNKIGNICDF